MPTEPDGIERRLDPTSLYREATFTDRRIGVIRVVTPLMADGSTDMSRQVLSIGKAQFLRQLGP
jgi:hypothetical protein